jgi:hypothetical protein
MFYVLFLRQEAERYRELATKAADPKSEEDCKDLAEVLEEVATELEDKVSPG